MLIVSFFSEKIVKFNIRGCKKIRTSAVAILVSSRGPKTPQLVAAPKESFVQQPATSVHSKATGEATGIIGMLEVAQSDFSKMLADATVEEESAIKEYEKITQENQVYAYTSQLQPLRFVTTSGCS